MATIDDYASGTRENRCENGAIKHSMAGRGRMRWDAVVMDGC